MNKKYLLVMCVLLQSFFLQAQTWDGSTSTDWNTGSNWNTNVVPTTTGVVVIPNTPNKPVLASNITLSSLSMSLGSALNFNGFNLTTSAGFDINGAILNNTNTGTDIEITLNASVGNRYFRQNTVNDNIIFNINSNSEGFYEGYQSPNTFNGNATFNIGGTAVFFTSYDRVSTFNGNVTVNRTAAGSTYIFHQGAVAVNGNFSYTNNAGGLTEIHSVGLPLLVPITGTINITTTGVGNPNFSMRRVMNQTGGGTISVQNSGAVAIANDTLVLDALNVNGFTGGGLDDFIQNSITGTVNISDVAANTGDMYFRGNTINGNTILTINSNAGFYEGYQFPDTFNGSVTFNVGGTAVFFTSYDRLSTYNGNVTVNRTAAGSTYIFHQGAVAVNGNFSYTNNAGGLTQIHSVGLPVLVPVTGTINITATGAGNPDFSMRRIRNQTGGGTISVQNSGAVAIANDTLVLNALNVTGFSGGGLDDLLQNSITGTVTISDLAANTGDIYFRGNTINGNTSITINSGSSLYESYQYSNVYNGNLNLVKNAGTVFFSYDRPSTINQNLTVNSAAGITFADTLKFGGSTNGIIEQLGIQPLTIPRFTMQKTGNGIVVLNDSVTISTSLFFNGGNIHTAGVNSIIFPNGMVNYSGASATSHVVGPFVKVGTQAFTFPVGGAVSYNPVAMSAPAGVTSRFKAEYKNQNPNIDGFNTNSKAASFGSAIISNAGYWDVQRLAGTTNVTLTLGYNPNPYEQYLAPASLKLAHWNGTQWDDHGNGGNPVIPGATGTVVNSTPITAFSPFAIAGVIPTYFFSYAQPGAGPDGTPLKLKGVGGYPGHTVKQMPSGTYTADSIFLVPNGSTTTFRLKDLYGVEKDTTIIVAAAPTNYISSNGNGSINFTGWRHFVYLKDAGNNIMGAVRDNDLTLGNVTMNTYFSAANVATAPNGNIFLKRSFRIVSQFAPAGTKRVRLYISKAEYNNLVAADPASFPAGINSLTITKYTGPTEESVFNPIPGGNAIIIPNNAITIVDLGTMYSLDFDVTGFSAFYIGGNNSNLNLCTGSTVSIPSNIAGTTYQWQVNTGSGFSNISDGGVYSGTGTSSLTITNATGNLYGYKFRALVNGSTPSQEYTLKYNASWEGTVSNVWTNPANWSCGQLPDANTDVVINAGKPNYPVLSSNATIRTLTLKTGTSATVASGVVLTVVK